MFIISMLGAIYYLGNKYFVEEEDVEENLEEDD